MTILDFQGVYVNMSQFYLFNILGQNMVRTTMPQMLQFPIQQTIPVQIPMQTANGQTIIQTVHIPVQTLANVIPNSGVLQGGQFQVIQPQQLQVRNSLLYSS